MREKGPNGKHSFEGEFSPLIRAEYSWPKGPFPGEAPGSSHIHNFTVNSSMKVLFPERVESFGVFLSAPSAAQRPSDLACAP